MPLFEGLWDTEQLILDIFHPDPVHHLKHQKSVRGTKTAKLALLLAMAVRISPKIL